ncbi:hypothetical protein CapIbe_008148 [Capra ibex]
MIRAALEARDVESTFQEEASLYVEGGIHRRDKEYLSSPSYHIIDHCPKAESVSADFGERKDSSVGGYNIHHGSIPGSGRSHKPRNS